MSKVLHNEHGIIIQRAHRRACFFYLTLKTAQKRKAAGDRTVSSISAGRLMPSKTTFNRK